MKASTSLFCPSVQSKASCYRERSLCSWLKSTQLRFRFKLYTYTPKVHQQNQKPQLLSLSSSEEIYQDPPLTKIAKALTHDESLAVEKKQALLELHQQQKYFEENPLIDKDIKTLPTNELQKEGRAIQIMVTPLKPGKKKEKLLKSTKLREETSSDEQFTLTRKRKVIKKGRKQSKKKKTVNLAINIFRTNE